MSTGSNNAEFSSIAAAEGTTVLALLASKLTALQKFCYGIHRLEVQCKTALLAILSPANMPRGLSSANATTGLIVNFLLASFSQITFHRNPNNVQLAEMVAGDLESDEQDSDVN